MPKQIIIAEQHHLAAVFWEDQIQELVVATGTQQVGDIFLGIVENVIPGIDAAFVNIGDAERNGFIHVTDLGPLRLKRSAGAITELLVPQQKVLVQVMKEPTGNKGPRLTGNVTMPGRYLVLMPYGKGVNLSRRIRNDDERSRLRALAVLIKPAGMGLLVRTEAEGKPEEAIMEDLEFLQKQWESTQQQALSTRAPALLNRDDDFIQKVLRDMYTADVNRIVTDSTSGLKRVKEQLRNWGDGKSPEGVLIDSHRESQSILEYFRVNAAIRESLKPRVDLPSGGYIIIEPTEALTVIDVNSGSFTRSATARETVLWTNSEAATEIARQLRLRNIGGVIIVDFIDMDSRRDQLKLLEHFTKCLKADKARPQIAQLSELGLVELTRKRQGKNVYELFGHSCEQCGGLGHLALLPGEATNIALETAAFTPITARTAEPMSQSSVSYLSSSTEPEDKSSQLNLINHPSYQEQSNTPNNRRRRRRRSDMPSKEGSNGKTPLPIPTNGAAASEEESSLNESRRERFSRPLRREREQVPVEKVSIEMTKLEQELYASMGISPLVRLEREFKDPKSVVIKIRLPGEEEAAEDDVPIQEIESSPVASESESTSNDNDATEMTTAEISSLTLKKEISDEPMIMNTSPELELETAGVSSSDNGDIIEAGEETKTPVRRRRRRSSASSE